ncbi:hypothetical protein HYU12_02430 [Candidatus Woesearchaeota archaeon]|nr:hypothetical protein [Candidatus Woesearchaeota archaeon]
MTRGFEYYLENNMAKRAVPNPSTAKSLIEKAEMRIKLINEDTIQEETASIIFEEIYEALREASQSFMHIKGFKPYSHEALIAFLAREKQMPESYIKTLDNYRILRNKSVYEAERVAVERCKEALAFAKENLPELKQKLLSTLKES